MTPTASRQGLHLGMPLAIIALAVWLGLTVGGRWLESAIRAPVAATVTGGIGLSWALAAVFALALLRASDRRRAAGLCAPQPWKTLWLVWPPLLYALLMLLLAWAGGWPQPRVLLIVACNTALVAISEELMFRAILLQGMLDRYAVWPAVLMSSALFGLSHTANGLATGDVSGALWQAVAAFLQGIAYAAIRLRTRSIWPMVLVHGLWDYALVTATLPHPAEDGVSILPYIALLAVLPLCLYGVYLLRPSQRAALAPADAAA
ncbi:CPBP family intramembrane metalloprotease [Janthinobacterium sp. SUN118]|uniref:CPBP family intramembrane glutamic endopeptidase n=1 Tax=Janthinobacterium sp. SUN118 TaxID=3004100 RepID=UPI0025B0ABC0|nr:CPBP family intramembrane glutamic endopeptidase [Janthinobacterium sp. SUN118]MDN2709459.1 CPBP family intramembrane metalloprotease [Janthinobacterium sp. SUN118]